MRQIQKNVRTGHYHLESQDEEEISKRTEMLSAAINLPTIKAKGERKVQRTKKERFQYSRRRKSSSRDKNVAKIRFIYETNT